MLVLARRLNEKIVFPGIQAAVQVVAIKPGVVRLGIDAPQDVVVLREEVQDRQREWGTPEPALTPRPTEGGLQQFNTLLRNRLKVTDTGLELLRRQMLAGLTDMAEETLAKIQDDLQLLRRRFDGEAENPTPGPKGKMRRALLVEDDTNERELLASFLRMGGLDSAAGRTWC
jgi:carbon storage regulator CsrA